MKSPQPPKRRAALKLLLLLLICLGPMIGALFLYQARDSVMFVSKNQGTLIIPSVNLEALGVEVPKPGRWMMTYYTPNDCDEKCQNVMAHFSVMEKSLIKDNPRIGSLRLSPEQTNGEALPKQLMPLGQTTAIWLVDPLGNIILRYDDTALDNRMLLDLRYLLKVSQIG